MPTLRSILFCIQVLASLQGPDAWTPQQTRKCHTLPTSRPPEPKKALREAQPACVQPGNHTTPVDLEPPSAEQSLVQYVFLAGVEGVGHHGVAPVLAEAARAAGYAVCDAATEHGHCGKLHRAVAHHRLEEADAAVHALRAEAKRAAQRRIVIDWISYPNGGDANGKGLRWHNMEEVTRAGDSESEQIVSLVHLHGALRDLLDLKIVLLSRSFVDSVWSHCEWDVSVAGHGVVMALMHTYLSRQLAQLPCATWRHLSFDAMGAVGSPQQDMSGVATLERLGEFLGWTSAIDEWGEARSRAGFVAGGIRKEVKLKEKRELSEAEHAWLQELETNWNATWTAYSHRPQLL